MKYLLLLWCAAALQAGVAGGGSCAGPVVRGVHHTDEVLYSDEGARTLDYDYSSNVLYFAVYEKLFKINIYSKELVQIENWNQTAFGASLDPKTGDLYLGGSYSIYKYDNTTNKIELFRAISADVWELFFKDNLYYVQYPSYFVYNFEDLKNTVVYNLLIDKDDYIIFGNNSGLFGQTRGTKDTILYQGTENRGVWDLTMNKYGDVYALFDDGVYVVDKQKHQVNRILRVADCRALAIDDKNNIIYSDRYSVHRLVVSEDQGCV